MAKTSTSWKPGQSGNPAGRPRTGASIIAALATELKSKGQERKLSKLLVKYVMNAKQFDWRAAGWLYDYFLKVNIHEENLAIKEKLDELEKTLNEIQKSNGKVEQTIY
jgi:hypothetical protein